MSFSISITRPITFGSLKHSFLQRIKEDNLNLFQKDKTTELRINKRKYDTKRWKLRLEKKNIWVGTIPNTGLLVLEPSWIMYEDTYTDWLA